MSVGRPQRILIICVSRIGDTLFATPAIRAIATAHSEAEITVLAHPKRAEVLEHLSFIAHVGHITKSRAAWLGWLPSRPFDLAFVFGFDESLVAYALRVARRVVAFEQERAALNLQIDTVVPRPAFQSEHAVHQLLRLPATVGIPPAGLRIGFNVGADERASARRRLEASGVATGRPLIGLQVASFPTKAYRDWPISYFTELCERISARWPDARFLIFGGPEEKQRTARLKEQLDSRAALFAGRLSLRETGALMSLTDLYIGVDTGPTHIMSAFDIPLVALYHCVSPSGHTGPLEHPCAYVIDHPAGHRPDGEAIPMAEISVNAVFAQVVRALAEHPPQSR